MHAARRGLCVTLRFSRYLKDCSSFQRLVTIITIFANTKEQLIDIREVTLLQRCFKSALSEANIGIVQSFYCNLHHKSYVYG